MSRLRFFTLLVVGLLGACGESSSHHPDAATAGKGSGAAGGMAGEAGAGAAGLSGAGRGGMAGAAATLPFPCGTASPVGSSTTGLERCSRGYQRRVSPANCSSTVPRSGAIPDYNSALDECESDADCPTDQYGPYAHCGTRAGGFAHACVAGCTLDDDCDAGNVCLCGDPVGRCVPSTCSTGADCAPGLDCASFAASPGCFSTEFACQTEGDACGADVDCSGVSPNAAFCVLEGASRACSIVQCTTP